MEYRILGKTGLKISRMGFGGIPIQKIDEEGTRKLLHEMMEMGVNYIDSARGYTHWTMTLLGGIVGMLLYRLHGTAPRHTLLLQALSGAFIITALEMVVGVLDNLVLQWHVWSYREMPWNVYGQICLPFSVLWFLVCIPALGICEVVRKRFQ